jgi:crotonobetainyl-CoA:carnitine CoA-transferase CaiB-like acyl-CoA transferase
MTVTPDRSPPAADQVAAWADSGAMWLTGRPGGPPLGPPAELVAELAAIGQRLEDRAAALGGGLTVEPLSLLGERAALSGLHRQGSISCGGSTRLLPAADGWFAVALARSEDVDLVPAWLECAAPLADPWSAVARAARRTQAAELVDRAAMLGLPAGALPERPYEAGPAGALFGGLPVRAGEVAGRPAPVRPLRGTVVVDLSSLWAGPLCGSLLAAAGASVVKVESTGRPDGARRGPPAFFDLLNAGKRSVALDLTSADGRRALTDLVGSADVVIEASRPRALEQLGIDAIRMVSGAGPRIWVSITGHGRTGPGRDRVAFGDDAAVAGGLVCWDGDQPCFCADAVADPLAGVVAAAAVLEALARGGRWLLDVSMAAVASHLAGSTLEGGAAVATPPVARTPSASGPALGEHTEQVLAELGRRA